MLLQWVVLDPSGPLSNLAAIRFSSSVKIRSLKIFPTGARPFRNQQEIVATTIPNSFYLDVYFHAQPIVTDNKAKPKPSNVLVPTSIAYQGGQVEFIVDSDTAEFATRLMIIRGKFEKLSLAIYGDIVSESSTSAPTYNPRHIPHIVSSALPPSLDVANKADPTELAQSLLTLIPNESRPQLPLIIRLMFCLKPSNEDWEEKDFPHLYSDLENGLDNINLEKAVSMTARPVADSVDEFVLRNFAQKLGESVEEYNDDQAYFLAKLLSQCAPQHPLLVRFVLEHIDLNQMYTVPNLDRPTLLYLLDAAASLDVSRQLNNKQTLHAFVTIRDNTNYDEGARRAASRLYDRVKGWEILEDSLLNTQAPFVSAASVIKDFATEENTFGIWLENMILNNEILEKLSENPPTVQIPYPPVFWQYNSEASHDDFIAFIRATIGVAAVVAVYAWSDSVPVENCRERALAVLRLWQNVSGYREIVNHFMLMRQMAYRLECMLPLENDLPSQAGIDAEHILKKLALQPSSMLRTDFVKVMQNLQAPLNYITDVEVEELRRASSMAKDGLRGAIDFLIRPPEALDPSERRLDLRIAIAVVDDTLQKFPNKEKNILDILWDRKANTLPAYLIKHLKRGSMDLTSVFGLDPPPRRPQTEIATVFQTCFGILKLLTRLISTNPVVSRDAASLTESVCDIFVCTDSADMYTRQESETCITAHATRQTCVEILTKLIVPSTVDEQSTTMAARGLKALLSRGIHHSMHNAAHHLIQTFWLLDHILSYVQYDAPDNESTRSYWVRHILSAALEELLSFYNVQDNDRKLYLIRRLHDIDTGITCVVEWILLSELKGTKKALTQLRTIVSFSSLERNMLHWKITDTLCIFSSLARDPSAEIQRTITSVLRHDEGKDVMSSIFVDLVELDFYYEAIDELIEEISKLISNEAVTVDRESKTLVMTILLRSARSYKFSSFDSLYELVSKSDESIFDERSAQELGEALEAVVSKIRDGESLECAESIFKFMGKITPLDKSSGILVIRGLTEASLEELTRWISEKLPNESGKLEALKLRWNVDGKPRDPPTVIPSNFNFEASLSEWNEHLAPADLAVPSTPPRRSPSQTAEMIGLITVSPPNALLRSPEVKGLTKTYSNNDFRQLRQQSSSRQNTSRLPSRHVDDFEQEPAVAPLNLNASASSSPLPSAPFPLHPHHPSLPMNPTFYQQ